MNLSKECEDLRADNKQLHQDMRAMEISYLSQLNNQCKINNDNIVSTLLLFSSGLLEVYFGYCRLLYRKLKKSCLKAYMKQVEVTKGEQRVI